MPSTSKTSCVILPYSKAGVGCRATLQKLNKLLDFLFTALADPHNPGLTAVVRFSFMKL